MKKALFSVLFILFTTLTAIAQKVVLHESGFALSDQEKNAILKFADYEAMIYNGLFNTVKNDSLNITINIYKKFSDYKQACQNLGLPVLSRSGFYSPAVREVFIFKDAGFMTTLVHEMSHCFMHNNISGPPRWFNEGIAVFFESLSVEDGEVSVTTQPARIQAVKREIYSDNVHLADFLELDQEAWMNKSKLDYMYNVSYSLVFFITKTNPQATKRVILALQEGYSSTKAIELVFGSIHSFELMYKLFYRQ